MAANQRVCPVPRTRMTANLRVCPVPRSGMTANQRVCPVPRSGMTANLRVCPVPRSGMTANLRVCPVPRPRMTANQRVCPVARTRMTANHFLHRINHQLTTKLVLLTTCPLASSLITTLYTPDANVLLMLTAWLALPPSWLIVCSFTFSPKIL